MKVEIANLEQGARQARGIAVIIDVFRAFTTAAHAFERGAKEILMLGDGDTALALKASGRADLCMGEAEGRKVDGFDFGNSPHAVSQADLSGKVLAQKTSNGTRGLLAATGAEEIYTGAFVTAAATVRCIRARGPETVCIVAMGAAERPAAEDEVCALYHRALLQGLSPDKEALRTLVASLVPPANQQLVASGDYPPEDRDLALAADSKNFAIRVVTEDGMLVARPEFPPEFPGA
jgi:2-phosphosulfolactate phosphatase